MILNALIPRHEYVALLQDRMRYLMMAPRHNDRRPGIGEAVNVVELDIFNGPTGRMCLRYVTHVNEIYISRLDGLADAYWILSLSAEPMLPGEPIAKEGAV